MNDFQKALEALKATDLGFLAPGAYNNPTPATLQSGNGKRRRRRKLDSTRDNGGAATISATTAPAPESVPERPESVPERVEDNANVQTPAPAPRQYGEHKLPVHIPPERPAPVAVPDSKPAPENAKARGRRRHVEHEWPAIGTILSGIYYGALYRAEVVSAGKRLKSGKQLKLLDGPAEGQCFDSLTKAMMVATVKQRQDNNLGRSGVANGWDFWAAEANPSPAPGTGK